MKVEKVEFDALSRIIGHLNAISVGVKQAIKPERITTEYPRERRKLPDNFRGLILFEKDRCISCFRCAFICPANAIQMELYDNYYPSIDYSKCIFCHFCVDSCPTTALKQTKIHDVAFTDLDEMVVHTDEMINPPELLREDKITVEYKINGKLVLERKREVEDLIVDVIPVKRIEYHSACINPQNCLGDALCALICPTNAITVVEEEGRRIMKIDTAKCTGCSLCVRECPTKTLGLVRREG